MEGGRVLGIDAGERRVGLALSDELRLLARPLRVLRRDHGLAPVLDEIQAIATAERVAQVVVGWPINADGSIGRQARRAAEFARTAQRVLGLPVQLWDERFSTQEARALLRAQGDRGRVRSRGEVDAVAAAVMLQDYLDAQGGAHEARAS
ncbi:MAG: Holliday junction resolvase RuvX [Chloroflexi bacterium]|nr:Holliday junction resolvase RuvX [Chloroflexota bacterium]